MWSTFPQLHDLQAQQCKQMIQLGQLSGNGNLSPFKVSKPGVATKSFWREQADDYRGAEHRALTRSQSGNKRGPQAGHVEMIWPIDLPAQQVSRQLHDEVVGAHTSICPASPHTETHTHL